MHLTTPYPTSSTHTGHLTSLLSNHQSTSTSSNSTTHNTSSLYLHFRHSGHRRKKKSLSHSTLQSNRAPTPNDMYHSPQKHLTPMLHHHSHFSDYNKNPPWPFLKLPTSTNGLLATHHNPLHLTRQPTHHRTLTLRYPPHTQTRHPPQARAQKATHGFLPH